MSRRVGPVPRTGKAGDRHRCRRDRRHWTNWSARGRANGLVGLATARAGTASESSSRRPSVIDALHVPTAGVVDFPGVAERLAPRSRRARSVECALGLAGRRPSGQIPTASRCLAGDQELRGERLLINCAGLHSDRVAALAGVKSKIRIVPFRGEYYTLDPSRGRLGREPDLPGARPAVPVPGRPFQHDGSTAASRSGPTRCSPWGESTTGDAPIDWSDLRETLGRGFLLEAGRSPLVDRLREVLRSRSRRLYARSARRLIPALRADHLRPGRCRCQGPGAGTPTVGWSTTSSSRRPDRMIHVSERPFSGSDREPCHRDLTSPASRAPSAPDEVESGCVV